MGRFSGAGRLGGCLSLGSFGHSYGFEMGLGVMAETTVWSVRQY